jgi:hypothetical protein
MATYLERLQALLSGDTNYINKLNQNGQMLAGGLDLIAAQIASLAGFSALSVPLGLQQIFDRKGLIGVGSFDFSTGFLSGPAYNLAVAPGAFWTGDTFIYNLSASQVSLAALATCDYYLTVDTSGIPAVSASPGEYAVRQFHWDAGTHLVSAKAVYSGVAILFDGDDYAACLQSLAKAKTFTKLADRLEEIERRLDNVQVVDGDADDVEIDWSKGAHARVELVRATTHFSFTGAYDGQKLILELIQGTGNNAVTFAGNQIQAGLDFTFPVPLSTNAGKVDYLGFVYCEHPQENAVPFYHYVSLSRGYQIILLP